MSRKVIQIATMPESRFKASGDVSVTAVLYALCDDGTVWAISYDEWNDTMRCDKLTPRGVTDDAA